MTVTCASGKMFQIDGAETMTIPLNAKEGDAFDYAKNRWESDRAWVFMRVGILIAKDGKVERVVEVSD